MSGFGQLNDIQRRDWLRLSQSENVGPITFRQLINRFGGASAALEALPELSARGGMRRKIKIYSTEHAERDIEAATNLGAQFIALGEPDYPPMLHHVETAPPLLCMKGALETAQRPQIAFVGSRNASAAGRKFTRILVAELAEAGYCVTSGLARGIDTAAHEASLDTGTCAVTACGLDIVYPPENKRLYEQICGKGLVLSEMVPGTRPKAEYFPRRNRIIAGMSLGVVIVEAARRSGSLITARLAAEFNRDVFAVPGSPLDPRAFGTNKLIKEGACLVTKASDILEVINQLPGPEDNTGFETEEDFDWSVEASDTDRERVAVLLSRTPVEIDEVIRESKLSPRQVLAILMELELAGRLERHPGQRVSLLEPDV